MKIDYTKGAPFTNEEREYLRKNMGTEKETVSNCCGAPLLYIYLGTESDICSQCLEHCDPEELE